jgi:hypothetical protein
MTVTGIPDSISRRTTPSILIAALHRIQPPLQPQLGGLSGPLRFCRRLFMPAI